jgi:hypothetical protein
MIDRSKFLELYARAIRPVVARMDQSKWDITRAVTLGGAGLSTALIFVVVQTGVTTPALRISLFCASLGVPVWLALWRVGEAYSFFGPKSYAHFASPQASGVGILLFLVGLVLLLASFVGLVWHFSVFSAVVFFMASIAMAVFSVKHQTSVQAWVEREHSNDG